MKTPHSTRRLAGWLLTVAFTGWIGSRPLQAQGSLTPPPGAPAPTMKTLDQIEPRIPVNATTCPGDANFQLKIAKPGSYYLTGEILGESGKTAILINASDVVLDLNGFTLKGIPGAIDGIHIIGPSAKNTAIQNGTIRDWSKFGIRSEGIEGLRCSQLTCKACGTAPIIGGGMAMFAASGIVEDCNFIDNVTSGLRVEGSATIIRCLANANSAIGFLGSGGSTFINCTASLNQYGFSLNADSSATGCTAIGNASDGFGGGNYLNCVATKNGQNGFALQSDVQLTGCTARGNGASGFETADRCSLEGCAASDNTLTGISCGANATLRHCTVTKNKTDGLHTLADASIIHCSAASNTANGIVTGTYALVEECNALRNGADGIQLAGGSLIRGCLASRNGTAGAAAGIHVTGTGSSIEANSTRDNVGTGILTVAGNIILRNQSGGNSVNNYTPSNGAGFAPVESPATQTNPSANF